MSKYNTISSSKERMACQQLANSFVGKTSYTGSRIKEGSNLFRLNEGGRHAPVFYVVENVNQCLII